MWVINITETTPVENLVIYYRSKEIQSWWFSVNAIYNGAMCEIRFLIHGNEDCIGNCFERATLQTPDAECRLIQPDQTLTMTGQLSEGNFFLVSWKFKINDNWHLFNQ